jgi:hypothetical protein
MQLLNQIPAIVSVVLVDRKDCLDFILIVHILSPPPEPLILGEMSALKITQEQDGAPKREPFDFSTLRFVVHLVTSADGCYYDRESSGSDSDSDNGYNSEEDMLEEDDDPWLKVGASTISLKMYFSESNRSIMSKSRLQTGRE